MDVIPSSNSNSNMPLPSLSSGLFKPATVDDSKNKKHKKYFPTQFQHEKSIVQILTTFSTHNYAEPWMGPSTGGCSGSGLVIKDEGKIYILTNAHCVENSVRVRVRLANDRKKKYETTRKCVSYQCDLALLEVNDPEFENLVEPVQLGEMTHLQQKVETIGFPMGGDEISITKGIVSRIEVQDYAMSDLNMLQVQVDSAVNHGNSGGPVFSGGKVVGVAFQGIDGGNSLGYMIPIPIIKHFLTEALSNKPYRGFPVLPASFQCLENPNLREFYGMTSEQTGVRVMGVDKLCDAFGKLKRDDILLEIDSMPVSNEGTVDIDGVGKVLDMVHVTHMKYIGDTVDLKVLRKNPETSLFEIHNINVVLDHVPLETEKVPQTEHDKLPTYYIASGISFVPLSRNHMDDGDGEFENMYLWEEGCLLAEASKKTPDEQVVVINDILDCAETEGYDSFKNTVITSINGKPINNIYDVVTAIEGNKNKMHEINTFKKNTIVVKNMSKAEHDKILKAHMIRSDRSDDLLPSVNQVMQDDLSHSNSYSEHMDDRESRVQRSNSEKFLPSSRIKHPKAKTNANSKRNIQAEIDELDNLTEEKVNQMRSKMSPGSKRFFDKIFELEDDAQDAQDVDKYVQNRGLFAESDESDEDISEEFELGSESESDYEDDEEYSNDNNDIIVENEEPKNNKRKLDAVSSASNSNRLFSQRSNRNVLQDSDDELNVATKRQKRR